MEDVATRRERLKALRERKEKRDGKLENSENSETEPSSEVLPRPVFRSYQPNDENLKLSQMPKVKPINVSEIVKEEIKAAQEKTTIEEVKLVHIAPRKIDWDLKRDISKKLEKLRRRTNRAIAEIAREELINGRTSIPFWNPREEPNNNDDDDDDD